MLSENQKEDRKCPSCGEKIHDERDKHWNERLICAKCCSKAHNCLQCKMSWKEWYS